MTKSLRLAALLAGSSLIGSAHGAPLVGPGDRIAIFGDSISTGKGYGYQAVELMNQERPELKLVWFDHGHPGWRADHATNAVEKVLADQPTLVTIMFGTNDLGQQGARGVAELHERLRRLVEPFQKQGIRVVLLTTPYTANDTIWSRSLNEAPLPRMAEEVFAIGREENVPVFDMFTAMRLAYEARRKADPEFVMFNGPGDCHPNREGHEIMARALADFLLGKKTPPRIRFVWKYPGHPVGTAVRAGQAAEPMVLDQESQIGMENRWKNPSDLSAQATATWDDQALQLDVEVTDDVVIPGEKQPAWDYDGIEFFFDTRLPAKRDVAYAPGYFQMLVAVPASDGPAPVACGNMDQLGAGKVVATSQRTASGYRLRVTVPWSELRFKPEPGDNIGFDFAINDRDDPKIGRYKALWRGAGDDYTNAGRLGTLQLR